MLGSSPVLACRVRGWEGEPKFAKRFSPGQMSPGPPPPPLPGIGFVGVFHWTSTTFVFCHLCSSAALQQAGMWTSHKLLLPPKLT